MWKTCMIKIFQSLKKKLKGNVRRWKDPSFLWINMINIAKKWASYNQMPIKLPTESSQSLEGQRFTPYRNTHPYRISKTILNNKRTSGGYTIRS